MGGQLLLNSAIGKGTTVMFDIPVRPCAILQPEKPTAAGRQVMVQPPGHAEYRILIADDDTDSRRLAMRLLAPLGFALREAANGEQAIEICQAWQPHLVWIDLRMPIIDGWSATKRIKTLTPAPVVIALTASCFEENAEQLLAIGCDDFLHKPFREADFFALLQKHLGIRFRDVEESAPDSIGKPDASIGLALRPELRAELLEALEQLDVSAVNAALGKILSGQGEMEKTLVALAKDYQYERMLGLLRQATVGGD